jgi:two-component system nitrogen regulation sensor histidine kinase GlnL
VRDYDPSLPELMGDREQLIQAVLNIARNAAQVGAQSVIFRTRAHAQLTIRKQRLQAGIRIASHRRRPGRGGRDPGQDLQSARFGKGRRHRLGLSLAQTFVHYHQGVIEFESRPGRTTFRILLPLR